MAAALVYCCLSLSVAIYRCCCSEVRYETLQ